MKKSVMHILGEYDSNIIIRYIKKYPFSLMSLKIYPIFLIGVITIILEYIKFIYLMGKIYDFFYTTKNRIIIYIFYLKNPYLKSIGFEHSIKNIGLILYKDLDRYLIDIDNNVYLFKNNKMVLRINIKDKEGFNEYINTEFKHDIRKYKIKKLLK